MTPIGPSTLPHTLPAHQTVSQVLWQANHHFQQMNYESAFANLKFLMVYELNRETSLQVHLMAAKSAFAVKKYTDAHVESNITFKISEKPYCLALCGLIRIAEGSYDRGIELLETALTSEISQRTRESTIMRAACEDFEIYCKPIWEVILEQVNSLPSDEALSYLQEVCPYPDEKMASIIALCRSKFYFFSKWGKAKTELCRAINQRQNPITKMYLLTNFAAACAATGNSVEALHALNKVFNND